ncbi:hypothetical protein QAD02_012113 [Eretmocerus hayati]|uniref:Uncharacterized protein n=1 Tax=Eretmocerus hayati TaxID=131215 RepID=A0ACC2NYU0_9HYME|nr:hypothetical protein QAD02_012113 [Eretmocerus hayati]
MLHLPLLWVIFLSSLGKVSSDLGFPSNILETYYKNPDFDQCDREQCLAVEEVFLQNINSELEPCDDFFKYACGKNFANKSQAAEEYSNRSEYSETLHGILNGDLGVKWNHLKTLRLEKEIYKVCEKGIRNDKEKSHYSRLLQKYGADRLDENFHYNSDVSDWIPIDCRYARDGFGFAFFDVEIVEQNVPSKDEPQRFIQIKPALSNILKMKELLMEKYDFDADKKYQELKDFIDQLIEIRPSHYYPETGSQAELQEISAWQAKYDAEGYLQDSQINFRSILNDLFGKISQTINNDDKIIVVNENYFYALARALHETNIDAIVNFIHLRFISETIGLVDDEFREYSIIPEMDGLHCTPGLLTGAAHVYARTYFPLDTKTSVEEIFDNVRSYAKNRIQSYKGQPRGTIISQDSKKVLNASVVVGYPYWVMNDNLISNFYRGGFSVSDVYLNNQLRCIEILMKNKLTSLKDKGYPILKMDEFFNSFMSESWQFLNGGSKMIIPANLFDEKSYRFVSAQLQNPMNYGSAGAEIASSLYYQWLSKIDYAARSPKCISNQMPEKIDEWKGNDFLNKAVSYLLGLQNSDAVRPNKDSYPIQFPRFGALSESRFFFLSFAETLCRSHFQENEMKFFINFAVSNTDKFSEAFGCYNSKQSYAMNRSDKCDPLRKS